MSDDKFPIFEAVGERVEFRYVVQARLAVPLKQVPSVFIGKIHIREDWQEIRLTDQTKEDFFRIARKYGWTDRIYGVGVSPDLFTLEEARALQALCLCWLRPAHLFDKIVELRIVQNMIKYNFEINGIKVIE